MKNTAVVLIDLQNDYCHTNGVFAKKAKFPIDTIPTIYEPINELIAICRQIEIPIIWVKMIWDYDHEVGILANKSLFLAKEGLRRNTWGSEIVSELDVKAQDFIVEKKRFSAFHKTELNQILQDLGIVQLIIGGVRTDFCVESTVRDAFFHDYEVTVMADGVAGYIQHLHEGSLKVMNTVFARVVNSKEIQKELSQYCVS